MTNPSHETWMECCVCLKWSRTKDAEVSTCDYCEHQWCFDCDYVAHPIPHSPVRWPVTPVSSGSEDEYWEPPPTPEYFEHSENSGERSDKKPSNPKQPQSQHEHTSKFTASSEQFTLAFKTVKTLPPSKIVSTCCKCKGKADVTFVVQEIPPCAKCGHALCPTCEPPARVKWQAWELRNGGYSVNGQTLIEPDIQRTSKRQ
jgi:hypothetical protein